MPSPLEFQETRTTQTQQLIKQHPFACIVGHTQKGLIATHIPLLQKDDNTLLGHMAVSNDVYLYAEDGQEVMVIVQGVEGYISANDYPSKALDHRKVPTWNYQVMYIHGKIKFLNEQKVKLAALGKLTQQQEQKTNGEAAWRMADAPRDYILDLLDDLVVCEIHIQHIEMISKLSQDKSSHDQAGVIQALTQRGNTQLAQTMQAANKNPSNEG